MFERQRADVGRSRRQPAVPAFSQPALRVVTNNLLASLETALPLPIM
jgi:hypothetical protein